MYFLELRGSLNGDAYFSKLPLHTRGRLLHGVIACEVRGNRALKPLELVPGKDLSTQTLG